MENNAVKPKNIGIDARFYGPSGKGLGRYTQEVVDNVLKTDSVNRYVIFLYKDNFDGFAADGGRVKKILVKARWYSLAEQVFMPYYIWREHLDLVHFPHFNVPLLCPSKFVVTIHDLILTKFPTMRATTLGPLAYRIKNLAYKAIIRMAVRRARKIIAVSEFTKNDIVENFGVKRAKIEVTYEGVAGLGRTASDNDKEIVLGYNIHRPYLLYVGNAYPHKNLLGLIRAFSGIKGKIPETQLVLVGKEDYFYKRVKDYAASIGLWRADRLSPVVFPDYVPDEGLDVLYRNAVAYVFASFYEGFGLPPLEAMARGCPVASSNKASMPEVLGDAALYFNPEDEAGMKTALARIVNDEGLRRRLSDKGRERVKKYSWPECAKKTLEIYNSVR